MTQLTQITPYIEFKMQPNANSRDRKSHSVMNNGNI